VRAVSFDAHGTLIAPRESIGVSYAAIATRHGIIADPAVLQQRFVAAFSHWRAHWPVPYGADEADARRFWTAIITDSFGRDVPTACTRELFAFYARAEAWRVLPGAREALTLLRSRRLPSAVCSNFDARVHRVLAGSDLEYTAREMEYLVRVRERIGMEESRYHEIWKGVERLLGQGRARSD